MKTKLSLPTYFISHGGGPWPWLKKEMPFYSKLEASLKLIPKELATSPDAILVISGHWEEEEFAIMSSPHPQMIYDYHGFPEHTYQVKYSAPGSPDLAMRVQKLIQSAGFSIRQDPQRGFDHGTYTPLVEMYPEAKIPVLQLSIRSDYDPQTHLKIGQALVPLRNENVLILASGLSYHNLRNFGPGARDVSKRFDQWLQETLVSSSPEKRVESLLDWEKAPAARNAHPQEDHLVPLFVSVGAALEEPAEMIYHEDEFMGGLSVSSFRFGSPRPLS